MTTLKRLAAAALSAAIVAAPVLTATAADAAPAQAGPKWTVIAKWEGAKQQACKKPVNGGKAMKIFTRVVNGRQAEVGVGLSVNQNGDPTDSWRSPIMGKGKTSKIGSVWMPLRPGFTLDAFQFQAQAGTGRSVQLKNIGRC